MSESGLYEQILALCQQYGRTTDYSEELIDNLVDSLIVDPTDAEMAQINPFAL